MFAGVLPQARADPQVLGSVNGQGNTGQDQQAGKPPPECQWAKPGEQESAHWNVDNSLLEAACDGCC